MLKVSKERADAARKHAVDFNCPAYFPTKWKAAEAQYTTAGNVPIKTEEDVQRASVMYENAADAYDEIFKDTIPLYAKAKEDEITAAREKLINSGFADYFYGYLQDADDKALLASSWYEAGDYYNAKDAVAAALSEYETMNTGAEILSVRREIIELDFVKYNQNNFNKADETAQTAYDEYGAGKKETAAVNAKKALGLYNNILANGWTVYAGELRTSASSERQQALNEKANIASRDLFNKADGVYVKAENSLKSRNYKDAAASFADSQASFRLARNDTEEKRRKAFDAIKLAEEKIEESNETVNDAERIIEGGTK